MNQVTHGQDDDEEEVMGRLISEAGDPTVSPRAEYTGALRSLILEPLASPRRRSRWRARLLVASGMAAAAVVAALVAILMLRPANAWAQVAVALQGRPWIHTRTLGPDGKEFGERWFSPQNGVSAVRHGQEL